MGPEGLPVQGQPGHGEEVSMTGTASGEYRQPRTRITYRIVNEKIRNNGTPTAKSIKSIVPPLSTPWFEGSDASRSMVLPA